MSSSRTQVRRRRVTGALAVLAVATAAGCSSGSVVNQAAATAPSTATTTMQSGSGQVCVTSASKGSCGPYRYQAITPSTGQTTTVGQNVWSPIKGWAQTMHATSPGNWYVTAKMPAGNTAVVSFPNTGQNYDDPELSTFSTIYSSFAEDMHATSGTSAEAAYDIWANDWKNEIMIQHDIVNRGSCPVLAMASFGGSNGVPEQAWSLCRYGSELIWELTGNGEQKGTVNVLAMLDWLSQHGYLPQKTTLTAISYGFEICSTGSKPEKFSVSNFSITASPK